MPTHWKTIILMLLRAPESWLLLVEIYLYGLVLLTLTKAWNTALYSNFYCFIDNVTAVWTCRGYTKVTIVSNEIFFDSFWFMPLYCRVIDCRFSLCFIEHTFSLSVRSMVWMNQHCFKKAEAICPIHANRWVKVKMCELTRLMLEQSRWYIYVWLRY